VEALIREPATPVGVEEVSSARLEFIIILVIFLSVLRMKDFPDPSFPSTSKNILGGGWW
jgi:hypothetical protein